MDGWMDGFQSVVHIMNTSRWLDGQPRWSQWVKVLQWLSFPGLLRGSPPSFHRSCCNGSKSMSAINTRVHPFPRTDPCVINSRQTSVVPRHKSVCWKRRERVHGGVWPRFQLRSPPGRRHLLTGEVFQTNSILKIRGNEKHGNTRNTAFSVFFSLSSRIGGKTGHLIWEIKGKHP